MPLLNYPYNTDIRADISTTLASTDIQADIRAAISTTFASTGIRADIGVWIIRQGHP